MQVLIIFGITLFSQMFLLMCDHPPGSNDPNLILRLETELKNRYPEKEELEPGEFSFESGIHIIEYKGVVPTAISKKYRLFRSQLVTPYEEYTFLDILIAVNTQNIHEKSHILFSPTFWSDPCEMTELFIGTKPPEGADIQAWTKEIATIYAALIQNGAVRIVNSPASNLYLFNLTRDQQDHRRITFDFAESGHLRQVELSP